jgi:hypothetical protein
MPFIRKPLKLTFTERRSAASSHSDAVRRQRRESNIGSLRGLQPANWAMSRPLGRPTPEIKSFDVLIAPPATSAPVVFGVSGTDPTVAYNGLTCINEIQLGDAYYNRIGSRVTVKSVSVSFQVGLVTSTFITSLRWMLVYDRQVNGAYPAIGDILSINDTGVPGIVDFNAGLNMVNRSRFLVLRDQYIDEDPAHQQIHTVKDFVKGRWDCEFNSPTSASIGVVKTGAIYMIAFGFTGGAINILNITSRVRYYD